MSEKKMPSDKAKRIFRYEDNPSVTETFADSIGEWFFDGSTLRIEFTVSRVDPHKGSGELTGRRYPTCRLVLTSSAAIELLNRCRQFTSALEKEGLVKQTKSESVENTK